MTLLVYCLVALVCLLSFLLWLSLRKGSVASRRRNKNAVIGEEDAQAVFEHYGFSLVAKQHRHQTHFYVNREAVEIEVRVDYIIEKDGQRYIAEVKTGRDAPNAAWPSTRRQLLEYSLIFPEYPVLLINMETKEIHLIEFDEWVG